MTFSLGKFFPRTPINEPSLELSDSKWKELEGGYKGEIYDASAALKQLEQAETLEATNLVYQELWNELHTRGMLVSRLTTLFHISFELLNKRNW
ncbi:hypothetical protein [Mucilaginibacter flavidus]|uniref:hypothetical protein n=1 Tax=Mucilaginibacter flavidus TaxID=2949309 RepID=UPI0020936A0D|nr:hypothetical protein [Mucilaginibacter flavidus]MCO5950708.1 hypothetical protein [Mucilaginibacter flavidus]